MVKVCPEPFARKRIGGGRNAQEEGPWAEEALYATGKTVTGPDPPDASAMCYVSLPPIMCPRDGVHEAGSLFEADRLTSDLKSVIIRPLPRWGGGDSLPG